MEQKKKKLASAGKNRFLLYVIDDKGREAVKYSQPKQSFCKLFSCHKYTNKVEEVITQGWIDANKTIHSKALYDDDKIYHQAKNIFEANIKFQQFINHFNNIQNEKAEIETANQELPN